MKKPLVAAAMAATALGAPQAARAEFLSGADLLRHCRSNENICGGYIAGVADAYQGLSRSNMQVGNAGTVCMPQNVSVRQLMTVVVGYVAQQEGLERMAATTVIRDALAQNYSCNNSGATLSKGG